MCRCHPLLRFSSRSQGGSLGTKEKRSSRGSKARGDLSLRAVFGEAVSVPLEIAALHFVPLAMTVFSKVPRREEIRRLSRDRRSTDRQEFNRRVASGGIIVQYKNDLISEITILEVNTMSGKSKCLFGMWIFLALTVSGTLMAQAGSFPDTVAASDDLGEATEAEMKSEIVLPVAGSVMSIEIPGTSVIIKMVSIPGGSFLMGSPDDEEDRLNNEGPQRLVTLSPFWLGRYEVTQEQWEAVMGSNPSYFEGSNLPVHHVGWNDCQEFIRRLNEKVPGGAFRLPSEAEWE